MKTECVHVHKSEHIRLKKKQTKWKKSVNQLKLFEFKKEKLICELKRRKKIEKLI